MKRNEMPPLTYCWTGSPGRGLRALRRSQAYTRVVTVSSWMVGCTSHRMCGTAQQPSEESQVESRAAVHTISRLNYYHGLFSTADLWTNPIFFSQRSKRTKKNVGEIKLGLNKCYPHL